MARIPLSQRRRFEVFERDNFKCQYCGATSANTELQVDHIHPVALGGGNALTNLITACRACNSGKRARRTDQPRPSLADVGVFDHEQTLHWVREGRRQSRVDAAELGLSLPTLHVISTLHTGRPYRDGPLWTRAPIIGLAEDAIADLGFEGAEECAHASCCDVHEIWDVYADLPNPWYARTRMAMSLFAGHIVFHRVWREEDEREDDEGQD